MIYLDHAATTPPCKAALDAFLQEATLGANPSSMHHAGFDAHTRLEDYRKSVARTVGARPEEITFTSGGTESANIALFGAARALKRRGTRILVSDAEHPCVSESVKALEAEGFDVVKIPTRGGVLDMDAVDQAANEETILADFMLVNNETGAIFDVARAFALVKSRSKYAVCFCDCVQAYGKLPLCLSSLSADILSLSAHKIHGVRGVGALVVKSGVRLVSPVFGGGQEKGLRSGTENSPAIAAFAAAASEAHDNLPARVEAMQARKAQLERGLAALDGVRVHGGFVQAAHIVSAAFEGYKSEVLLHLLSDRGICVSAGSACSSKKGAKSPILLAHGISAADADCTLRFSLSYTTTEEEILATLSVLEELLTKGRYRK